MAEPTRLTARMHARAEVRPVHRGGHGTPDPPDVTTKTG